MAKIEHIYDFNFTTFPQPRVEITPVVANVSTSRVAAMQKLWVQIIIFRRYEECQEKSGWSLPKPGIIQLRSNCSQSRDLDWPSQELDSAIPNKGNALIIKVKLGVKLLSC